MSEMLTVTVLVDNTARRRGQLAEHGLSLLIERGKSRFLLDTGQGHALLPNAQTLGIDLSNLSCCILSHGHYDHTGALLALAKKNKGLRVAAHPEAFAPRYSLADDGSRSEIGIGYTPQDLPSDTDLVLESKPQSLAPGFLITGEIPRQTSFERVSPRFVKEGSDGRFEPDTIVDDQAVVIETSRGLVVLLGCCHAGLINTLEYVKSLTGQQRFHAIIGGLHLVSAKQERIDQTLSALRAYEIDYVMPLHCTGFIAAARFYEEYGSRFLPGTVGTVFQVR